MSPVEIAGIPKCSATNLAWVPLPAPGGPIMISRMSGDPANPGAPRVGSRGGSTQESFVVSLLELALDLLHRVQRDAHHDEDGGATEREVLVRVDEDERDQRDQRDQTEVQRTRQRYAGQDVGQVVLGRLARPDPGDEAAVLLHVVSDLLGVEGDRDVEVGEEDDEQEERDHVHRVAAAHQVVVDPGDPLRRAVLVELHGHRRQVEQRRGEDDRDDAGLVHLQRYVRRAAAEHLAPHHAAGVLDRDPALRLLDEDDGRDDHQADGDDDREDPPALLLADRPEGGREPGDDLGEDQQRHAVADAALGDQLAEPHDDGGAGGHGDHHDQEGLGAVAVQQRLLAAGEQAAGTGQGHDAGRLEQGQAEREVTGVLGDLGLPRLPLLLQRFEPRDDHDEQLQDDAGGDVGHDPQREDRQLEQRTAREQVDQAVDARVAHVVQAGLDVGHIDARGRDLASEPEDRDDHQDEQQLAPQVRSPESVRERA